METLPAVETIQSMQQQIEKELNEVKEVIDRIEEQYQRLLGMHRILSASNTALTDILKESSTEVKV